MESSQNSCTPCSCRVPRANRDECSEEKFPGAAIHIQECDSLWVPSGKPGGIEGDMVHQEWDMELTSSTMQRSLVMPQSFRQPSAPYAPFLITKITKSLLFSQLYNVGHQIFPTPSGLTLTRKRIALWRPSVHLNASMAIILLDQHTSPVAARANGCRRFQNVFPVSTLCGMRN